MNIDNIIRTFVNETSELVYVQVQGEIIISTPGHPYYVVGKGWVCAGSLEFGDRVVLKDGSIENIQSVKTKRTESPVKVYNFEVEEFHTYFVGENEVLVHNTCGPKNYTPKNAKRRGLLGRQREKETYQ